jgi:hypothetical protein
MEVFLVILSRRSATCIPEDMLHNAINERGYAIVLLLRSLLLMIIEVVTYITTIIISLT